MRVRRLAASIVLVALAAACSSSEGGSEGSAPVVTLIPTTIEVVDDADAAAPDTDPADTESETVAPVDDEAAATESLPAAESSTTPPPETTISPTDGAPTTAAPTTVPVPTTVAPTTVPAPTTAPAPSTPFTLDTNGLGSTSFGADPDSTIAFVSSFLGEPTADTGWLDSFEFGLCTGAELRQVNWGNLQLEFGDASVVTEGRRHFYAYQYGREGESTPNPPGLETAEGIAIGSTLASLIATYPTVTIIQGDEFINDNFLINDNLAGRLSGLADDDVVQMIIGGLPCES